MPWRLITILIIFALFLVFTFSNYDNKCVIGFGFASREAPVLLIVFTSFFAGMLCVFPFMFRQYKKKKKGTDSGDNSGSGFGRKTGSKNSYYDSDTDKTESSGSGNYGID